MSAHQAKFVKVVPMENGNRLIRDCHERWVIHYPGDRQPPREITIAQSDIVDAAIIAGMEHQRVSK